MQSVQQKRQDRCLAQISNRLHGGHQATCSKSYATPPGPDHRAMLRFFVSCKSPTTMTLEISYRVIVGRGREFPFRLIFCAAKPPMFEMGRLSACNRAVAVWWWRKPDHNRSSIMYTLADDIALDHHISTRPQTDLCPPSESWALVMADDRC
jgi:hypothetical protein